MFNKGDIISISFRNGYDKQDNPIIETLERAEVLEFSDDWLSVAVRNVLTSDGSVELDELIFRIHLSNIL
jgi:hypothetical protein